MKNIHPAKTAGLTLAVLALVFSGMKAAEAQFSATQSGESYPAASSLSFLSRDSLVRGQSGADVASLQGYLSELGYLVIPAGVSPGFYGPLTESALARYQQALGISATGAYNAQTRSAILAFLEGRYPGIASAWSGTLASGSGQMATNDPGGATGYWYNGNWYSAVPGTGTTAPSNLSGYWLNGTWYSMTSPSSGSVAANPGNLGYWYNGVWQRAENPRGGYYSTNPAGATVASSGSGYWYGGVWYPTSTSNIGGGQSSDVGSGSAEQGFWYNGQWYSASSAGRVSGLPMDPTIETSTSTANF